MARGGKRENAGRKPGSLGKITVEIKASLAETAKAYTGDAIRTLVAIMRDKKATAGARVTSAVALLDRAHGKPLQHLEHTGKDGGPIEHKDVGEIELARRLAFLLAKLTRQKKD